jgi:hypothetical protein
MQRAKDPEYKYLIIKVIMSEEIQSSWVSVIKIKLKIFRFTVML